MIDRQHPLPVTHQCQILALARSSVYAIPRPVSAAGLALMRQLDELHLQCPFAGSRMLRDLLRLTGVNVGRKHMATLMRRMGIAASTSTPAPPQAAWVKSPGRERCGKGAGRHQVRTNEGEHP